VPLAALESATNESQTFCQERDTRTPHERTFRY
jgi:hypothetical protein